MFEFLAFISNKTYWKLHSSIIKIILCFFYKIKVGDNFYIEGFPHLKVRGKAANIIIGDNVSILGNIDLRNIENGKIHFMNNVTIERDCRFVSAWDGIIENGEGSIIAFDAVV